jgi:antirestriction protein ArdC
VPIGRPGELAKAGNAARKRFGDEGYAMEELVAELNAAFLSADLGLTPSPREEHAAYIASWLKSIFNVAAHARSQ